MKITFTKIKKSIVRSSERKPYPEETAGNYIVTFNRNHVCLAQMNYAELGGEVSGILQEDYNEYGGYYQADCLNMPVDELAKVIAENLVVVELERRPTLGVRGRENTTHELTLDFYFKYNGVYVYLMKDYWITYNENETTAEEVKTPEVVWE